MYRPSLLSFASTTIFFSLTASIDIDSPEVVQYFSDIQQKDPFDPCFVPHYHKNGTVIRETYIDITLAACNDKCGPSWHIYPTLDIQQRIATWYIPVFLLIGSLHYASLGFWNIVHVIIHLLADPISSFESLLSKLIRLQEHHKRCSRDLAFLPTRIQRAVAMILAAYEEWEHDLAVYAPQTVQQRLARPKANGYEEVAGDEAKDEDQAPDMFHILKHWLGTSGQASNPKQVQRRTACLQAANEISDCRDSGLPKTLLGVVNYIVAVAASFVHIAAGQYNNRTGHSIAMAVMQSWLIPTILLCSLVGGYATKRSSEDVLERLYQRFRVIEEEFKESGDSMEPIPAISRVVNNDYYAQSLAYESLKWSGGNYTFLPCQGFWGKRQSWTWCIAHLPVICATTSAFFISYTSPTAGIGCRSMLQAIFGASWICSSSITRTIQQRTSSTYHQWLYVLIKDSIIFVAQSVTSFVLWSGWFNSCFCWSSWFSLRGNAHVVLTPSATIVELAKTTWVTLTLSSILGQLLLVACLWLYFRQGANLFHVSEQDRCTVRWAKPPRIATLSRIGTFGLGAALDTRKVR